MKWIKLTTLFLFAAILVLLDTSFFANLSVHNASIVSVFQLIIIFALIADTKKYLFFAASTIIFFSVFSSLPIWLIALLFFILPSTILYLRKSHLPLPSVPVALILFLIVNLLFEIILLFYVKEWNKDGLLVLYYFVIINTIFGATLYYFYDLFLKIKTRGGKIKNI